MPLKSRKKFSHSADVMRIEPEPRWGNRLLDVGIIGGVGYYALGVRMIAERDQVTLLDYEVTTDFDDQIELLDAGVRDHGGIFQRFHLEPEQVLNSRFESPLRFCRRGQVIEGWLVAAGSVMIPSEYDHGAIVRCQLNFWDQFEHKIGIDVDLSVDRLKPKAPSVRPRAGLFDLVEGQEVCSRSVRRDSNVELRGSVCLEEMPSPEGEEVKPK